MPTPNESIISQLKHREVNLSNGRRFTSENYLNESILDRFQFETELRGHNGCVNCLDWSEQGDLLLSGSDDTHVIAWDPFSHTQRHNMKTAHTDNIFAVQFIPHTSSRHIATGAGDNEVFVYDLTTGDQLCAYTCGNRVKRIVTTPAEPHCLWSASEDGVVREFDFREPFSTAKPRNLIDLNGVCVTGTNCKTLAINPTRPHLLAIGANDPFVRLYDRRMIPRVKKRNSLAVGEGSDDGGGGCVSYFTPGHLYLKHNGEYQRRMQFLNTTHVAFSPDGNELMVNIGAEQIYLFDINSRQHTIFQTYSKNYNNKKSNQRSDGEVGFLNVLGDCPLPFTTTTNDSGGLPTKAQKLKEEANDFFKQQKYNQSIFHYNAALKHAPQSSVLYGNRAAAFLKRQWNGDHYAALRDCHMALTLNKNHMKAHFRMAKCLFKLGQVKEAQACLNDFKRQHANHAKMTTCTSLQAEINSAGRSKTSAKSKDSSAAADRNHNPTTTTTIPGVDARLQSEAHDYKQRFCGHCNTVTDIKEANFFGPNGKYIVAGSDDGSFFIWEKDTGNLVRIMRGDTSIVNCLQPHPFMCLLATSGIDHEVKLWSPGAIEEDDEHLLKNTDDLSAANQLRMNRGPFEALMHQVASANESNELDPAQCATS